MSSDVKLEIIKSSPFSNELTDEQSRELAEIIETHKLEKDDVLISEGNTDHTLYVVINGSIAVAKSTSGGDSEVLHVLHAGELAGAMGFIDGCEHSATLRAIETTLVFSVERSSFENMLKTHPEVVYVVMRGIIRSVHGIVRNMNNSHVEFSNYINKQHGRY